MGSKIEEAMAAVAAKEREAKPVQIPLRLSTGRNAIVVVPADFNSQEALDLVAFIAHSAGLAKKLGEVNSTPKLVVAAAMPKASN